MANSSGHMSHHGAHGTEWTLVAPNELARLASLQLVATRRLPRVQDFLPVIKLLCLTKHRRLLAGGAPSRAVERSTVLPLPRTLRAGLRQGRCAASRTALARGALPKVGGTKGCRFRSN